MKPTLLVMAAGLGSRYGGLKQLDAVGPSGETLLEYSVYDAIRAGFDKVVFIIQEFFAKEFKQKISTKFKNRIKTELVYQELHDLPHNITLPLNRKKPWGTGHAIWVAREAIKEPFVTINADDFYGSTSFQLIYNYISNHSITSTKFAMVGYQLNKTYSSNGPINRGICKVKNQLLQSTTECLNITPIDQTAEYFNPEKNKKITLTGDEIVSINFWGFTPEIFKHIENHFSDFLKQLQDPLKQEFFLPDVISKLVKQKQATVKVIPTQDQWFGVSYPADKVYVIQDLYKLIKKGEYPKSLWN